jgi:hypothetical protein
VTEGGREGALTSQSIGGFEVRREGDILVIRRLPGAFAFQTAVAVVVALVAGATALGFVPLPPRDTTGRLTLGVFALSVLAACAAIAWRGRGVLVFDRRADRLRRDNEEICPLARISHLRNLEHVAGPRPNQRWWEVTLVVDDEPIPRAVGLLANQFQLREDADRFAGVIAEFLRVEIFTSV